MFASIMSSTEGYQTRSGSTADSLVTRGHPAHFVPWSFGSGCLDKPFYLIRATCSRSDSRILVVVFARLSSALQTRNILFLNYHHWLGADRCLSFFSIPGIIL